MAAIISPGRWARRSVSGRACIASRYSPRVRSA
ncbi:Uncharacterised protein [Bordetella pertussis]|nr:Uncharacterised protein [Bordetella pertussis]